MKDLICADFQNSVEKCLLRHRSILDLASKMQEATARTNRALVKSVTCCGCVEIHAHKQRIPDDTTLDQVDQFLSTHLNGTLCPDCREQIEAELGALLFYVAALSNVLDISLYDVMVQEQKKMFSLGPFAMG